MINPCTDYINVISESRNTNSDLPKKASSRMITAIIMFFFLLIIPEYSNLSTSQQNITNKINIGSSLSLSGTTNNNSYWLSDSGQFAFGFYKQNNGSFSVSIWFHNIKQKTVVWSVNTPLLVGEATLIFNSNGILVLRDGQGAETAVSQNSRPADFASMLDSGNFVLYGSDSTVLWQSFDFPTDTLLPGQRLLTGKRLANGRFVVLMQNDGNLVQYPSSDKIPNRYLAYWDSQTSKVGRATLNLDGNGQLYLLNSTGFNVKSINRIKNQSQIDTYRLSLDFDGILRLYQHSLAPNGDWVVEWVSTTDKCDPIGLCGVNSYCRLDDQQARCLCLPGFDFIDQNDKSFGCERNSGFVACDPSNKISFEELSGLQWEDNSYSAASSNSSADCEEECLRDCNCEIALYANQLCDKQKFPLRYAKVAKGVDGATTIVKVSTPITTTRKQTKKILQFLTVGLTCIIIALTFVLLSLLCRNRLRSYKKIRTGPPDDSSEALNLRSFTYEELNVATNGFVETLGRGAFGTVFKGTLGNGQRTVAVKRLEKIVAEEGEVEFRNEMRSIGKTHHRNLLRLVVYCDQGSNRLLVYDYMKNGSLSKFLFESPAKPSFEVRLNIVIGIARGIRYLHEECESQIIHCYINPNNVLIDDNLSAKIADFGLAKLLMPDQTRTTTGIRGTRGFICPEWHKNLPITAKADVFSFGVVLFVAVCCRRSVDVNVPERETVLVEWVYECFKRNELRNLVRDEEVDERELERMVKIGLWCVQEDPSVRPHIKKVVSMLEGTLDVLVPPSLTSYPNS